MIYEHHNLFLNKRGKKKVTKYKKKSNGVIKLLADGVALYTEARAILFHK